MILASEVGLLCARETLILLSLGSQQIFRTRPPHVITNGFRSCSSRTIPISSVAGGLKVQVVMHNEDGSRSLSPTGREERLEVRVNMRNNSCGTSYRPLSSYDSNYPPCYATAVLLASDLEPTCEAISRLSSLIKIHFWLKFGVGLSWGENLKRMLNIGMVGR